ncbi:MAG: DMT family transporter [Betaproteobacteria bacterium]|nr:DMT family transporter [Pseudomonadota bacterium]NBO11168.1 DMT family transporter [Betaproteobacteria bacterium]NBO43071.1 DMT family transporter [Betaproteobacteria bacterium]NBP10376.1 DMT family transporter [Betaproteobacteria bacterium]NBP62772.1 DMT family transporter [Betaproteobacteria bacterium]
MQSAGKGPWLALCIGVGVVSTAALLIRWALQEGASALEIAAARLCLAALAVWPIALWTHGQGAIAQLLRTADPTLLRWTLVAGLSLAAHFALWISSLDHTSVASSVALVTTNPIWVALAAWLWLGERPGRKLWIAIGLSMLGSLLISWKDLQAQASDSELWGNLLALMGAMAMSGYMLAAKVVQERRPDLPLLPYVAAVYSLAAFALTLMLSTLARPWWHVSSAVWPALLLLALGPQLIGHTLINFALRKLSPTLVAIAILGEPIAAALLAWFLLAESLAPGQLVGFALIIIAVLLAR